VSVCGCSTTLSFMVDGQTICAFCDLPKPVVEVDFSRVMASLHRTVAALAEVERCAAVVMALDDDDERAGR